MKKVLLIAGLAVSSVSFAQNSDGGAFSKGSSVVGLGYGFLSPWKSLFKVSVLGGSEKFSSFGPIGVTYENGVTDHISVGGQVAFSTLKNVYTYSNDILESGAAKQWTQKLNQVSVIIRGNYHFGSSAKFDPYVGLGLGYYSLKFTATTNDPDVTANSTEALSYNITVPGAFGFTGQLGARYYFTDKIGAYAELGYLAGSFAQIGVVAKF